MPTTVQTLINRARVTLLELSAGYWTDQELLDEYNNACKDLWGAIIDLYQDHFWVKDTTNMTIPVGTQGTGATAVSGVPATLFRILKFRPQVIGALSPNIGLVFQPRNSKHPDFVQAEAATPCEPRMQTAYYALVNAGAPAGTVQILVAPPFSSIVNLTVEYVPVVASTLLANINTDTNPVPGECDKAIVEYIIAFARAKERPDRSPDPEHISIYGTEKRNLLTRLTPRSDQEPDVVESFFMDSDASYDR